jgi:hypothetical protein
MTRHYIPVSVEVSTHTLLVKARGKMEHADGKKRSFDAVIRELAQKELTRLFE